MEQGNLPEKIEADVSVSGGWRGGSYAHYDRFSVWWGGGGEGGSEGREGRVGDRYHSIFVDHLRYK